MRAIAAASALTLLLVAGCGDEGSEPTADPATSAGSPASSPSSPSSSPAQGPDCAEVWQAGATLPAGYRGCADADGVWVEADRVNCSSGQHYFTFDDRFYAVPGAAIREAVDGLAHDREYRRIRNRCRG